MWKAEDPLGLTVKLGKHQNVAHHRAPSMNSTFGIMSVGGSTGIRGEYTICMKSLVTATSHLGASEQRSHSIIHYLEQIDPIELLYYSYGPTYSICRASGTVPKSSPLTKPIDVAADLGCDGPPNSLYHSQRGIGRSRFEIGVRHHQILQRYPIFPSNFHNPTQLSLLAPQYFCAPPFSPLVFFVKPEQSWYDFKRKQYM